MSRKVKYWGKFSGTIHNEWIKGDSRNIKILKKAQYFDPSGEVWTANVGDIVDGASVPWLLRLIFPIYVGLYKEGTVFHDVYCNSKIYSSWKVHKMFYQAMRCNGVHVIKAWIMWFGVRYGGPQFKGQDENFNN